MTVVLLHVRFRGRFSLGARVRSLPVGRRRSSSLSLSVQRNGSTLHLGAFRVTEVTVVRYTLVVTFLTLQVVQLKSFSLEAAVYRDVLHELRAFADDSLGPLGPRC